MRYNLILVLFILSATPSFSQSKSLLWHQGSMVLKSNEVFAGDIQVHLDFNTLVFRSAENLSVYAASKVKSFRLYDKERNVNRQFIVLNDFENKKPLFYELVVQGDWKVVRKLNRTHDLNPDDKNDYVYFIYNKDTLIPIRHFKRKIFPDFIRARPDLYAWVKEARLDLNQKQNAVVIVLQYNRLNATQQVASR